MYFRQVFKNTETVYSWNHPRWDIDSNLLSSAARSLCSLVDSRKPWNRMGEIENNYTLFFRYSPEETCAKVQAAGKEPEHGNSSVALFLCCSPRRKLHARCGTDGHHATLVVPANPRAGKTNWHAAV